MELDGIKKKISEFESDSIFVIYSITKKYNISFCFIITPNFHQFKVFNKYIFFYIKKEQLEDYLPIKIYRFLSISNLELN